MADLRENCIEWVNGDSMMSVTLSQVRLITKVRKIAEKYPNLCTIIHENPDGSIFAHLALKALKLSIISPTRKGFPTKSTLPFGGDEEDE